MVQAKDAKIATYDDVPELGESLMMKKVLLKPHKEV